MMQEVCPKCGETFKNLKHHLEKIKKKSCIGVWYVCKRCGEFFEFESALLRHQSTKSVCELRTSTPLQPDIPREMSAPIRYLKAINDCGSKQEYLQRAVKRGLKQELLNVMEACSLDDLAAIFDAVQKSYPAHLFKILAVMSDFANQETVSLEKRAMIREFVDRNVTL